MRERRAYICTHKGCQEGKAAPYRVFLLPGEPDSAANCKEHGTRMMVLQTNSTYRGNPCNPS